MQLSDVGNALTGQALSDKVKSAKDQRRAIVDGLLYENTILMISAGPGVGKSTVSAQLAIELSAGLPVFSAFVTAHPMKVLYLQTERPILEFLERAEALSRVLPINHDNLVISDCYKILNLLKEDHVHVFIDAILRDCPDADVIIVDPIYPMVSGGLSKDEPASAFCKAMSLAQKATGAAFWYNHHTVKPTHDQYGSQIEKDDPFYGSQWLKAHVTGSYLMKDIGDGAGVKLIRKKDNYNVLKKEITLEYNPESGMCTVPQDEIASHVRVLRWLQQQAMTRVTFDFRAMQEGTQLSVRALRESLRHPSVANILIVDTYIKNKKIYRVSNRGAEPPPIPTLPTQ